MSTEATSSLLISIADARRRNGIDEDAMRMLLERLEFEPAEIDGLLSGGRYWPEDDLLVVLRAVDAWDPGAANWGRP